VSRVVVLDATPLGMVCHPNPRGETLACNHWLRALDAAGARIVIPEVVDYEVRRELLRVGRPKAIRNLDGLIAKHLYLPLTTAMMRHAAELWARVRRIGLPTAGPESLDADAVLAAQALSLNDPAAVVATSNPSHLSRFVPADVWRNIPA
jgi:predicted nucleic acid-binding protein